MKIDYGCGEVEVVYSIETLAVYEQEFARDGRGADLIADIVGKVEFDEEELSNGVLAFDYSKLHSPFLVKALWAGLYTAGTTALSYEQWARGTKCPNLIELSTVLAPVIFDAFFPSGAGDTEKDQGGES